MSNKRGQPDWYMEAPRINVLSHPSEVNLLSKLDDIFNAYKSPASQGLPTPPLPLPPDNSRLKIERSKPVATRLRDTSKTPTIAKSVRSRRKIGMDVQKLLI